MTVSNNTPHAAPLTIVLGCDTFSPDINGAARFAERLAAGLVRRGHDVHIVAPSKTLWRHGTFRELIEGAPVTVHRLASLRWYPHDWLRFALPWRLRRNAARILDALQPDVVHFQSHVLIGRGLALEATARGVRVIGTNHVMAENVLDFATIPSRWNDAFIAWAWRSATKIFRLAAAVTTPTRKAADFLEQNTGLRGVIPVSCGIDATQYTPKIGARTEKRLLFVGRLTSEKNIDVLLRALTMLPDDVDCALDIVGGGDQAAALQALAVQLGVDARVAFHGRIGEDRLRGMYRDAALWVMPSIAELQSIATLEAMASGLPVVCADAMALPHLVEEGVNGFLFTPGDPRRLAERIAAVLRLDEDAYVAMQRASLAGVAVHDMGRTLDTFERLYRGEAVEA